MKQSRREMNKEGSNTGRTWCGGSGFLVVSSILGGSRNVKSSTSSMYSSIPSMFTVLECCEYVADGSVPPPSSTTSSSSTFFSSLGSLMAVSYCSPVMFTRTEAFPSYSSIT